MFTPKLRSVAACMLMALAFLAAPLAYATAKANAEPQDLDVDIIAKIAKERAKTNAQTAADRRVNKDGSGTQSDGCGNIGIGNIFADRPGFQPPRQVTVVVTGDIVSANNNCRN